MANVWKQYHRDYIGNNYYLESYIGEIEAPTNSSFGLKLIELTGFLKWEDGTKTIVKCGDEDEWDVEKGLAMCYVKKLFGNEGNYYDKFMSIIDPNFKKNRRKEKNEKRKEKRRIRTMRQERIKELIAKNNTTTYEAYDLKRNNKNG